VKVAGDDIGHLPHHGMLSLYHQIQVTPIAGVQEPHGNKRNPQREYAENFYEFSECRQHFLSSNVFSDLKLNRLKDILDLGVITNKLSLCMT